MRLYHKLRYRHVISFLSRHDLSLLKSYWETDFLKTPFSWGKFIILLVKRDNTFFAWWRLANEMHIHGCKKQRKTAQNIQNGLIRKYNVELMLGLKLGHNPMIDHWSGIVIHPNCIIGDNLKIMHNVTIALGKKASPLTIGDNVLIGANSVILGANLGNNVTVGAASFIDKNIDSNSIAYTKRELVIKPYLPDAL